MWEYTKNKIGRISLLVKDIAKEDQSLIMKFYTILFLFPLAILFVLIIRALRPLVVVRICELESYRIGHFASVPGLYMKTLLIFFIAKNQFVTISLKR